MGTAADMENVAIESLNYKELTVTAIVTAGLKQMEDVSVILPIIINLRKNQINWVLLTLF